MLCPRCGTPNRAKAVRCLRCGSSLKGRPTAVDPVPNRPMPEAPSTKQSQLPRFQSEEATLHDGDKQVSLPPPRTASVRPPISEVGFNDQTEGRTNMLDTPTMIDPASDTGGESDEWAELLAAARPGGSKVADPASARRQQRAPTAAPVEPQVAVPAHRAPPKKPAPAPKGAPERRPPGANTMRALANDLRAPVGPRTPAADSGQRRIANAPTNARTTPGTPRNSTAAVRPTNAPLKEPMNPSAAKLPAFRSDTKPPPRRRRPIPSEPKVPSFPAPTPSAPDLDGMPFVDETKPLDPLPTAKRVENKPTAPLPKPAPVQQPKPAQQPMTDDLHLNTGPMRSMPVEFDPVEDEDGPPDENTRLGFLAEPPSQPDLQLAQPDLQLAVTPIPDIIQPDDSRDMARKELQRLPSDTSDEPLEVTRAFVGELDPDFSMPGDPAPLGSETDWSPAADRSDTAIPRSDTAAVGAEPVVSHRGPTETPQEKRAPESFASLPRRMGSLAIDAVVLVALFLCLGVAGILGEPWASIDLFEPDEVGRALILGQLNLGLFVGLVLAFLYSLLCHGIMGRSLGKLIVGTKLVRSKDGESPSWSQTSLRAFLAIPGTLLAGIGIMWPFLSPRSRSLHDILSRTLVVRG